MKTWKKAAGGILLPLLCAAVLLEIGRASCRERG